MLYICIFQPVTQGDITGYQVCYNGTMLNANSSTTRLTFTTPSLPNGPFTHTVVVMVTAVNRYGIGPASDPETAIIYGKHVAIYIHVSSYVTMLLMMCITRVNMCI